MDQVNFDNYKKLHRRNYEVAYVEKNFYKVLRALGTLNPNETIIATTIRLKGYADWTMAKKVIDGLRFKISRKFWGRKSKYNKLPMIFAIESSKNWDKEHLHGLIRVQDPKQYYTDAELSMIIKDICHSLQEVNKNDPQAVIVRTFPFCEDITKVLGNSIEYICKTSSRHCDPLAQEFCTNNK